MSTFEVPIVRVTDVSDHPNADRLSLINFRGFTTISAKLADGSHRYNVGDLVVYVPEGAVVPENLLRKGFWKDDPEGGPGKGMLHGAKGDRVKAVRLRGIVSQGIMFGPEELPPDLSWVEGADVSETLGIVKYEPVIPTWSLVSRSTPDNVFNLGVENTINFDIENLLKFPHVLDDLDEVVAVTEKLHGTFCQVAYLPGVEHEHGFVNGGIFVGSKGLSAKGLMFRKDEATATNLYVRSVIGSGIAERFVGECGFDDPKGTARMYLVGEIFGTGVQDLGYGAQPAFRAFGVFRGNPRDGTGRWLNNNEFEHITDAADIPRVPLLALARWGDVREMLSSLRDGKTTLGGDHIREGVVITPVKERRHRQIGRVILKAVSPAYLLRKGEVTEFA